MNDARGPASDFHRQSAQLRDWCGFAVVVLVVSLTGQHLLSPVIEIAREGGGSAYAIVNDLVRELAAATPAIIYAGGLWALRNTFARLAEGATFGPAVIRGLGHVGSDLGRGALFAVVITPNILAWTDGTAGGFAFDLEIASVVIGLVGFALTLLARLLTRAAAQEDELRSII